MFWSLPTLLFPGCKGQTFILRQRNGFHFHSWILSNSRCRNFHFQTFPRWCDMCKCCYCFPCRAVILSTREVLNVKTKLSPPTASFLSQMLLFGELHLLCLRIQWKCTLLYLSINVFWLISANSHSWFPSVQFGSCSPITSLVPLLLLA